MRASINNFINMNLENARHRRPRNVFTVPLIGARFPNSQLYDISAGMKTLSQGSSPCCKIEQLSCWFVLHPAYVSSFDSTKTSLLHVRIWNQLCPWYDNHVKIVYPCEHKGCLDMHRFSNSTRLWHQSLCRKATTCPWLHISLRI